MRFSEEQFVRLEKDTNKFLHFLQECKFSGSWDTKVDLNVIIKMLANYQYVVNSLKTDITELENKIKELTEK